MPGLLSQIASALSGGDTKLVGRIEEFASGYLIQGEVSKSLALKREEAALLSAILAEELYRSYCASRKKECSAEMTSRLLNIRRDRESRLQLKGAALERLEAALRTVAVDLTNLAQQRGKFETQFASVDGLTESQVTDAIGTHAAEVKAAKRGPQH